MTTWFVTRHAGAREWAEQQGITFDRQVTHLDPACIAQGDTVIGALPVNIAADLCRKGARYLHIALDVPFEWRGEELSAEQLEQLGAHIEEFRIYRPVGVSETVEPDQKVESRLRIVSFLGTGDYKPSKYYWHGVSTECVHTAYTVAAIARLRAASEVFIVATNKAWARHGPDILLACREHCPDVKPHHVLIAEGQTPVELWEIFPVVHDLIQEQDCGEILIDITHGFRSLPVFASAIAAYYRTVADDSVPVSLCYGAWEASDPQGRVPVWDLTPFVELIDWSNAIGEFVHTGRAALLVAATRRLGRRRNRAWAMSGKQGEQSRLSSFAAALEEFADDLATVRVGALIHGRDSGDRQRRSFKQPSAIKLQQTLETVRQEIESEIPPLAAVLDRIDRMIQPLCSGTLSGTEGHRALANLAELYMDLNRFPEAAIVLREAWISRQADDDAVAIPSRAFDLGGRKQLESQCMQQRLELADLSKFRNDIGHGGFNADPQPPSTLKHQLRESLSHFRAAIQ